MGSHLNTASKVTRLPVKRQNHIVIDESRDALLSDFGKAVLADRYLYKGESIQ
jgi:hypothetical protein